MRSVNEKTDINWECGLLLPVDYPTSLETNTLIGKSKRIGKRFGKRCCRRLCEVLENLNFSTSAGCRQTGLDKTFLSIFLNWEFGLLLLVDYLTSLENYILIGV